MFGGKHVRAPSDCDGFEAAVLTAFANKKAAQQNKPKYACTPWYYVKKLLNNKSDPSKVGFLQDLVDPRPQICKFKNMILKFSKNKCLKSASKPSRLDAPRRIDPDAQIFVRNGQIRSHFVAIFRFWKKC